MDNIKQQFIELEKEEMTLAFDTFTHQTAYELGQIIIDNYERIGKVAFEIVINDLCIYSFYPEGTSKLSTNWIKRKRNTVNLKEMSSLRMGIWMQMKQVDLDYIGVETKDYTYLGGGYPIRLKNGALIGSIASTGLHHLEDHRIIVESLNQYFETKK